jgi:hypothetical protein
MEHINEQDHTRNAYKSLTAQSIFVSTANKTDSTQTQYNICSAHLPIRTIVTAVPQMWKCSDVVLGCQSNPHPTIPGCCFICTFHAPTTLTERTTNIEQLHLRLHTQPSPIFF